ncbi:MAG: FIST signal transduction protein [Phycisphaerales bacterium]
MESYPRAGTPADVISIGAGVSGNLDPVLAAEAACEQAAAGLSTGRADLVVLFVSGDHIHEIERVSEVVHAMIGPDVLLACTGVGVLGGTHAFEGREGVSLLAADLPGTRLDTFVYRDLPHIGPDDTNIQLLADALHARQDTRAILLLADPFSVPAGSLVDALSRVPSALGIKRPMPIIGGMASSATTPGNNALILNDHVHRTGGIGLTISGDIEIDTLVSQGCRPIGKPMIVTDGERNLIKQLGGKPALQVLQDLVQSLPESDRTLLQNGMFVGRVIDEYKERFGRGDFLIRGVIGVDRTSGSIAIGDGIRRGQTVQFQLRDARTAREDLDLLLTAQTLQPAAHGALLFTCNGRGKSMFSDPANDPKMVAGKLSAPDGSPLPLAGFFAGGEIGPVGDRSFIHGHTASLALFRDLRRSHDRA